MDYLLICHNDTKFENIQYFSQNACQLRIFSIVLDSKEFQCHCKSFNIEKSVKICIKWALYCSDTKFSNFIINEQIPLDFLGKVLHLWGFRPRMGETLDKSPSLFLSGDVLKPFLGTN